jgi:hypothetical protein
MFFGGAVAIVALVGGIKVGQVMNQGVNAAIDALIGTPLQ